MNARPKFPLPPRSARLSFASAALVVAMGSVFLFRGANEPRIAGAPVLQTATPSTAPDSGRKPQAQIGKDAAGDLLTLANPDDLLSLLREKLGASGSAETILAALAEIARARPALAIELAQTLGRDAAEKSLWVSEIMRQWSERNPQLAWEWLTQFSADRIDRLADGSLPRIILDAMAAREPQRLTEIMDALVRTDHFPAGIAPAVAVHLGLQALIKSGDVALAQTCVDAWARDAREPDLGRSVYETVALALGKTNPLEAGRWLTALPLSEERNAAISTFAATWVERDPAAALQWTAALAPQDGQHAAVERAFRVWIESDAVGAVDWLGEYLSHLPAGSKPDRLIGNLVASSPTLRRTPELARQWTELISNPERRASSEEQLAWRWSRHDLPAATNFVISSSSMAWEQKQALLQKMQGARASSDLDE
jgi:hypothetical protein